MIPALIFWKIWLTYQKGKTDNGEKTMPMPLLRSVRKNLTTAVILLLVCLVELVHIVKHVGTTGVAYAGYEGFNLLKFLETGIKMSIKIHAWVILLQLAVIGVITRLHVKSKESETTVTPLVNLLWPGILCGMILVPQVVLYTKSGMM
jgi:hypothetical protein